MISETGIPGSVRVIGKDDQNPVDRAESLSVARDQMAKVAKPSRVLVEIDRLFGFTGTMLEELGPGFAFQRQRSLRSSALPQPPLILPWS